MNIEQIRDILRRGGAKPCHEERILRAWTQGLALDSGPVAAGHFLPRSVRATLPELSAELAALARLRFEHAGAEGATRLLVELADGQTVESVLLPRDGLCAVSYTHLIDLRGGAPLRRSSSNGFD